LKIFEALFFPLFTFAGRTFVDFEEETLLSPPRSRSFPRVLLSRLFSRARVPDLLAERGERREKSNEEKTRAAVERSNPFSLLSLLHLSIMASVSVEQLVLDLADPATRENALLDLSKKRESFPELAPYLWHSFGTVSALLQVRIILKESFVLLLVDASLVEEARAFAFVHVSDVELRRLS